MKQFKYLEQQRGTERAIVSFRKMAHWYLKRCAAGTTPKSNAKCANAVEFEEAVREIARPAPTRGSRTGCYPICDSRSIRTGRELVGFIRAFISGGFAR